MQIVLIGSSVNWHLHVTAYTTFLSVNEFKLTELISIL